MQQESVITRTVRVAGGVYAPGHLGQLTQIVDFDLVDAVLAETGAVQRRLRRLPSRVVVYFVLALALFEHCSYQAVWAKLTAALTDLSLPRPAVSSLARARRRVGTAPLCQLFNAVAGPVGRPDQPGVAYRGLRTVAIDGTTLHTPDEPQLTWHYPKRAGENREFGYPLLRLLILVECGTRALLSAAFGPETRGELHYATRLLPALNATMLLLADAAFDAATFLDAVAGTGAQFLVRGDASRRPTITERLPDGSYLTRIGYRTLRTLLPVRIIEATITVTLADGTIRNEQWRLLTSLLDHRRHPATDLVHLYHERWQAETTYATIKATILDGRILRSRSIPGLDQEIWALLITYQALIRTATDAAHTQPGLDTDRISSVLLLTTAADTVTTASNIIPTDPTDLLGVIGRTLLANLLPTRHRQRCKARTRKHTTNPYHTNTTQHPKTTQPYTTHTTITIFEQGLDARKHR